MLLVYLGGMATAHYRLLPYTIIRNAVGAARDWRAHWRSYLGIAPTKFLKPARGHEDGVVVHVPGAPQPGLTFITGMSKDGVLGLRLIDLQGTVRHRWRASFSSIWPSPEHIRGRRAPDNDWDTEILGAVLLPDGDVVFNFDQFGLQRLDACGRLVWKLPYMTHHSVFESDDGHFWVPGLRHHDEPDPALPGIAAPFDEDVILEVSPDGKLLREIPLLKLFYADGLQPLLFANGLHAVDAGNQMDLLHLNDIEVLSESDAPAFPLFAAGDILLSLRNLNLVLVIDPASGGVKWMQTGPWIRQHDPDFMPDGRIMVFDNRRDESGKQVFGGSRILAIDPVTRKFDVLYEGSKESPFYTPVKGQQQLLANGDLLITEAEHGRAFEAAPDGRIVWSFVNRFDEDRVAKITDAKRYPEDYADLAGRTCTEPTS